MMVKCVSCSTKIYVPKPYNIKIGICDDCSKKKQDKFTLVKAYCLRCGKGFEIVVEKDRKDSVLNYDTFFCSKECAEKRD